MLEQYLTQLKTEIFVGVVIAVFVGMALWHVAMGALDFCLQIIWLIVVCLYAGMRWCLRALYRVIAALVVELSPRNNRGAKHGKA
jgi:hypothetical protein